MLQSGLKLDKINPVLLKTVHNITAEPRTLYVQTVFKPQLRDGIVLIIVNNFVKR